MGKKLMLAVAMMALVAAPSFAAVQNVKVSGDLKTTSVIRSSFDLGANSQSQTSQSVALSQIGLNVMADLTDNVSTNLRFINESIWGSYDGASANNSGLRFDTAYVTMKELLYAPLTLTVGRQPLAYGNQFLIGDGDSTTAVSSVSDLTGGVNFDAIKAVLSYDPLTVDLFAAKVSEGSNLGQNDQNDVNLFGVNAAYKLGDKMSSVVEGYVFAKMDKSGITGSNTKAQNLYVPGLRVSTNPIEGLNVQLEGAYQVGDGATNAVNVQTKTRAYGLQGMVNYALPVMKDMKPVLSMGYTYLSGDKSSTDSRNTAFNSLYENQNAARIFDALFTRSNLKIASFAVEMSPLKDVTSKLSWYNLSAARGMAGSYTLGQPDGASNTATMTNKKALGNEFDLDLNYAYTEDVKFGVSAGVFLPGKAFDAKNKDMASQVLSSVSVLF
jgi:hypothetical protein